MDELDTLLKKWADDAQTVRVEDYSIPGFTGRIEARLYVPANVAGPLPCMLYFHGGGFIGGDLEDADLPARHIAANVPTAVLSVAYSLAPSHPFPAAPEDAFAAARWLQGNALNRRIDTMRLAVGGDDAGGNIAATLAFMARDRNGPAIAAQVLIGPMLDPSLTNLGDAKRLDSDIKPSECAECYAKYLPATYQRLHPYASPLLSRRLRGLPPAMIATAERDVLHREAELYATALIDSGVPTQIKRYPVKHGELPIFGALLEDVEIFLRQHLRINRADSPSS